MLNLEEVVKNFAREKNISLNDSVISRVRGLQRSAGEMSDDQIVEKLGGEEKFELVLLDRQNRKKLAEAIKRGRK